MRVNFTTRIYQWLRKEDGGALAELAILDPVSCGHAGGCV